MNIRVVAASVLGLAFALQACSSSVHYESHPTGGDAGPSTDGGPAPAHREVADDGGTDPAPAPTKGSCTGLAACTGDVFGCSKIFGCTYKNDYCKGEAAACETFRDTSTCAGQAGCFWSSFSQSCKGYPSSCTFLTADECTSQQGCESTTPMCTGTPTDSCSDQTTADTCKELPGCTWN